MSPNIENTQDDYGCMDTSPSDNPELHVEIEEDGYDYDNHDYTMTNDQSNDIEKELEDQHYLSMCFNERKERIFANIYDITKSLDKEVLTTLKLETSALLDIIQTRGLEIELFFYSVDFIKSYIRTIGSNSKLVRGGYMVRPEQVRLLFATSFWVSCKVLLDECPDVDFITYFYKDLLSKDILKYEILFCKILNYRFTRPHSIDFMSKLLGSKFNLRNAVKSANYMACVDALLKFYSFEFEHNHLPSSVANVIVSTTIDKVKSVWDDVKQCKKFYHGILFRKEKILEEVKSAAFFNKDLFQKLQELSKKETQQVQRVSERAVYINKAIFQQHKEKKIVKPLFTMERCYTVFMVITALYLAFIINCLSNKL
jgi:hypothetical protein